MVLTITRREGVASRDVLAALGLDPEADQPFFQWRSPGIISGAPAPTFTAVPFGASGWRKLQVTQADAVDRSAVAFDDSAWTLATMPFGPVVGTAYAGTLAHATSTPGTPATVWPVNTNLWVRRTIVALAREHDLLVTVRADNGAQVFWNGTLVDSQYVQDETRVIVPAALVLASNVLAVKAEDDLAVSGGDQTYLDVKVELSPFPATDVGSQSAQVVNTNPIAYWRFGEAAASATAADSSGNAKTITYSASVSPPTRGAAGLVASDADLAVSFNGTTNYIEYPTFSAPLDPNQGMGVRARIRSTATGRQQAIVGRAAASTGFNSFRLHITAANKLEFQVWDTTNTLRTVTGATSLAANTTYDVAGTFDGRNLRVWVNGVLDATFTMTNPLNIDANGALVGGLIGVHWNGSARFAYFQGTIDEVVYWNYAPSPLRVAAIATASATGPIAAPAPPDVVPPLVDGWILDPDRSAALMSWTPSYGRPDPSARAEPIGVTVSLASSIAGSAPELGERFRLTLCDDAATALGLGVDDVARFTGEVTDVDIDPARGVQTITGVGQLARALRRGVDGRSWPVEDDGNRVARILLAAAPDLIGDLDAGTANLITPTDATSKVGALLDLASDSTGGQVLEQPTGAVDWHDAEHRRGVPVTVTLNPDQILNSIKWSQHVGALINAATIAYGGTAGGEVVATDAASVDLFDTYPVKVTTALADSSDAYSLGSLIVGRRGEPVWSLPALVIDLARSIDPATELADLLTLRNGDRIAVTGLPLGGPYSGDVEFYVEGFEESATQRSWRLALAISDTRISGVSVRWLDAPAALTWDGVVPTLSWLDVATIENPAEL